MSSYLSHHPQEGLLTRSSRYVHKGGLNTHSFIQPFMSTKIADAGYKAPLHGHNLTTVLLYFFFIENKNISFERNISRSSIYMNNKRYKIKYNCSTLT